MSTERFIIFSNALEGRETDYFDWYVNQHIYDTLRLPGLLHGQFFKVTAVDGGETKWRYCALYGLDHGGAPRALAEIANRRGTSEMPLSNAIDSTATTFLIGKGLPLSESDAAESNADTDASHRLIVLADIGENAAMKNGAVNVERRLREVLGTSQRIHAEHFALSGRNGSADWRFGSIFAVNAGGRNDIISKLMDGAVASQSISACPLKACLLHPQTRLITVKEALNRKRA